MTNCLIKWLFVITMFSTASGVPYFKKTIQLEVPMCIEPLQGDES